ncbi:hypothetical protein JTB14_028551 [Gonioctena quinquepunctata]|nr:hypothetical protein JTB14_028551 [Gonioctena quinquepunctata]
MVSQTNIIQWNCNGLRLHLPELQLIKNNLNPIAFVLQETHLRPEENFNLRGYQSYRSDVAPNNRARGGVAIYLKDHIPANDIRLNPRLQSVAIYLQTPRKLTICSIYLPDYHWHTLEIRNILQLPETYIIMGVFNAHSPLWGRRIENILDNENITILNSGEATHFSARSSSFSSIDLTMCTPNIAPILTWKPLDDLHSSDHFPIQLTIDIPPQQISVGKKWLMKKANWEEYSQLVSIPDPELYEETDHAVEAIISSIVNTAHLSIPKSNALVVNDTMITTDQEMSEAFADHYESVSSSLNYDPDFRMIKAIEEMRTVDFETDESLYYNDPFSPHELDFALSSCKESAPGYDDITYAMIQHLAPNCKNNLLKLYNKIWASKVYPNNWKVAIIIHIPKHNGISTDPKQYRPISLISCLGKIFEKMINVRLTWVLESNSFLSKFQVGCRRNNSSTDALIAIDSEIRKAFDEKEHLVAVLLDLQKAYDMTWRDAIIKQLHLLGLRGTLPMIVNSFLLDRFFSVRTGSYL